MKNSRQHSIKRYSQRALERMRDQTDYQALDKMMDSDIDYSDIPETDENFWLDATVQDPGTKKLISC